MTKTEVKAKIAELEAQRANPGRYPTEIYTRIVGYYRSLANWNAGKREEYRHRRTFAEDQPKVSAALAKAEFRAHAGGASFLLFTQKTCPQCPPMKAKAATLDMPGNEFDVRTPAGYEAATTWDVTATPTLIVLDADGHELTRVHSATDWGQVLEHVSAQRSS